MVTPAEIRLMEKVAATVDKVRMLADIDELLFCLRDRRNDE